MPRQTPLVFLSLLLWAATACDGVGFILDSPGVNRGRAPATGGGGGTSVSSPSDGSGGAPTAPSTPSPSSESPPSYTAPPSYTPPAPPTSEPPPGDEPPPTAPDAGTPPASRDAASIDAPPASSDARSAPAPALRGGTPLPSAGCGKANPTVGARSIATGGASGNYIVALPAGYDAARPYPMGFAFHGFGLDEKTCAQGRECPGFPRLPAITVYMKSLSTGWEDNPFPLNANLKFFADVMTVMKNEYCVDENRVFVAGVSSGGQFVEHLACKFGDQLWAVVPLSAYVDAGVDVACQGAPAQLIIHGITDELESHGHAVRDLYARRNGCPMIPPGMADAETRMKAAFAAQRSEYACVDYPGCARNPLRWCVSSQITYNGLTHGWPQVGGQLIGEFLDTLK
jgi:polyhydroxybutyrate depolymerase